MNIIDYVIKNWDTLPKSTFDGDTVVIVQEFENSNEGYGHHSYQGIGVGFDGNVFWAYSSGCSCNGNCGLDHEPTTKVFQVGRDSFQLSELNPENINFRDLEVSFESY